jgi:hypothetical protein
MFNVFVIPFPVLVLVIVIDLKHKYLTHFFQRRQLVQQLQKCSNNSILDLNFNLLSADKSPEHIECSLKTKYQIH